MYRRIENWQVQAAADFFQKAADAGHVVAMRNLGVMYFKGVSMLAASRDFLF